MPRKNKGMWSGGFYANLGKLQQELGRQIVHINESPIAQWFKEQFGLSQSQTRKKGFRL